VKRAIVYARVSTREQGKGYSLETQVNECRAYAERKGFEVVQTIEDKKSGTLLRRNGLDRIRDLAEAGAFDVLVVHAVDRLTRKAGHRYLIEKELAGNGVRVRYARGDYADTPEGEMYKDFAAMVAEYEHAKLIERSIRGRRGKAQAGHVLLGGSEILGYDIDRGEHTAELVIDEDEARIVRQIFQWYVYGDEEQGPLSMLAIAKRLTSMGIPTVGDKLEYMGKDVAGYGEWGWTTVRAILDNATYYGVWYYNKTKRVDGRVIERPEEEWVAVEVPAIIDKALWDAAQERRQRCVARARRSRKWDYLLSGHLTCLMCGSQVWGKTVDQREQRGSDAFYQYYHCGGNKSAQCDAPYLPVGPVDEAVWGWVEDILADPQGLRESMERHKAERDKANEPLRERLALVEDQIEKQAGKLEKLLDLYLSSDDFPRAMLDERKRQIEGAKESLERERDRLARHLEEREITAEQIETVEEFAQAVQAGLEGITFDQKRRILDVLSVEAMLGIEDGDKVVYVTCEVDDNRLSVDSTMPTCHTTAR
jgi:site-specific DNA recombinase